MAESINLLRNWLGNLDSAFRFAKLFTFNELQIFAIVVWGCLVGLSIFQWLLELLTFYRALPTMPDVWIADD